MGTLILDRKNATLECRAQVLTVRVEGEVRKIPLKLLERVQILADIAIPSTVLTTLSAAGVQVCIVGRRQRHALMLAEGIGDVNRLIAQVKCYTDETLRLRLVRFLVAAKIASHARFLRELLQQRPDQRLAIFKALQRLAQRRGELKHATQVETLRGLEGAAARDYFEAFQAVMPPALGFTGRNRRPPRDPVNAVLSLGYTFLYSEAVAQIVAVGLDPRLGFLHDPAWGRASLAADFVEPWRVRIDALAWTLFRNRTLRAEQFCNDGEAVLLGKAGRSLFFPACEVTMRPIRTAMRRQAARLTRFLLKAINAQVHTNSEA